MRCPLVIDQNKELSTKSGDWIGMRKVFFIFLLCLLSGCGLQEKVSPSRVDENEIIVDENKTESLIDDDEMLRGNESWPEFYYEDLRGAYPERRLELIDINFDMVPELFDVYYTSVQAVTEIGVSYQNGSVESIGFGEFSVPTGFQLYQNRNTGEKLWMTVNYNRGYLHSTYEWLILDFEDLSYVKRIHFFQIEEIGIEEGDKITYIYKNEKGEIGTFEELKEAMLADYEPIEVIHVFEEINIEDKEAFFDFCAKYQMLLEENKRGF